MANTVSLLSYANTFGEWVLTTNKLAQENNDLAANNYTKSTGTVFLNDNTLGLQVANNAVFGGQLQSQGVGSSAYIQNNLRVDKQTYLTNTSLSLVASGQANIAGIVYATASGTGLNVSNNVVIGGNTQIAKALTVTGATQLGNTLTVTSHTSIGGNMSVDGTTELTDDLTVHQNVLVDYDVEARNITARGTLFSDGLEVDGTGDFAGALTVGSGNAGGDLTVYGDVTVDGKFIVTGSTVNSSNTFFLNDGNTNGINSRFGVFRGTDANAEIRWSESAKEWHIRDVLNPTSYSKILTANLISDTFETANSHLLASRAAANTLNNKIIGLQDFTTSVTNVAIAATNTYSIAAYTQANAANNLASTAYDKANNSTNRIWGTTGSVTSNGAVWFKSTNGMTFSGSGTNLTINTPQSIQSTGTPTFAGLTLTSPLEIESGGTGASDKNSALFNLVPSTSGVPAGYVLATGGGGGSTFYWAAGGTGGGGGSVVPGTTIQTSRRTYTANGAGVSYTTPEYTPGSGQLRVYFDGVRQFASEYNETSSTVVTFGEAVTTGTKILFEVDGYFISPYYANTIPFTAPFGGVVNSANTIQLAIESVETRKATIASPDFTGFPKAPTAPLSTSNTQISTTAFVHALANSGYTLSHSIDGNAATVTNGVYTNVSYTNPSWLASIASNKITGTVARSSYLDGTQLDNIVYGKAQSMPMSYNEGTGGSFETRATGTGDANLSGMTFHNTGNYAIKLGLRADGYFGLGGWSRAAWSWYSDPSGNMVSAGNVTAYSDPRLKEGFVKVDNPFKILNSIDGGTFTWKHGFKHTEVKAGKRDYGILADQVESVMPEIVTESIDIEGQSFKTVAYEKMVPVLIEAIKELKAEIEVLKGNNK